MPARPGEVTRALECGFLPDEISYTGTNVSERDLDVILAADGLRLNLDAISQIERVGRRAPGRTIGIRVNPARGAGYHAGLEYSGDRPTKFGIYEDRLDEAVDAAARHGLTVDTVHFHAGSGWLADGLRSFEAALEQAVRMTRRSHGARLPDPRGQRRRRTGRAGSRPRDPGGSPHLRRGARPAPRAARRDRRL